METDLTTSDTRIWLNLAIPRGREGITVGSANDPAVRIQDRYAKAVVTIHVRTQKEAIRLAAVLRDIACPPVPAEEER